MAERVLVVGGGVIGIACAAFLQQAGCRVTLLERDTVGGGASRGNCGLLYGSDLVPLCHPGAVRHELRRLLAGRSPLVVRPSLAPARLAWFVRFARHCRPARLAPAMRARAELLSSSVALYAEAFDRGELCAVEPPAGVLLVFEGEEDLRAYRETNGLLAPWGCAAEEVPAARLAEIEPALRPGAAGGFWHRADRHLRPERLMESWKQAALRAGVELREGITALGFRREGDRIAAVRTDAGEFAADQVVMAAGAWTTPLARKAGIRLPIQPGKGYSRTHPLSGRPPTVPCYFYERRVVVTPFADGVRVGGTMEFAGFDLSLHPDRLEALRHAAAAGLAEPPAAAPCEPWAGLRPMSPDDLPLIGRAPGGFNLWIASGHGMLGLTAAAATGRLLAELVTGRRPHIDPRPFSPRRFR